jgi:hypothetical protein
MRRGKSMGRIDTFLAAMRVEEKIGQLNMVASFRAVTGPGELRDVAEVSALAYRRLGEPLGR